MSQANNQHLEFLAKLFDTTRPEALRAIHQLYDTFSPELSNTWLELYAELLKRTLPRKGNPDNPFSADTGNEPGIAEYQWFNEWLSRCQALAKQGNYPSPPYPLKLHLSNFLDIEFKTLGLAFENRRVFGGQNHRPISRPAETQLLTLAAQVVELAHVLEDEDLPRQFLDRILGIEIDAFTLRRLLEHALSEPTWYKVVDSLITLLGYHINSQNEVGLFQDQEGWCSHLKDWELYRLIAQGRELHRRSFDLLYGEIQRRLTAKALTLPAWMQQQDESHRHRFGFLSTLGQFQRLRGALTTNADLRSDFLNALPQATLGELFLLSRPLSILLGDMNLSWRSELEKRIRQVAKQSQGRVQLAWQTLAEGLPEERSTARPPYENLFVEGTMLSKLYFTQPEDYERFLDFLNPGQSTSAGGYLVVSRTDSKTVFEKAVSGGRRLRIIATTDLKDVKASLKDPRVNLIVHRGYAPQLRGTFPGEVHGDRLFLMGLGSGEGFRYFPELLDGYPGGLPVALRAPGVGGSNNNRFLYYLLEGLAEGANGNWTWDQVRTFISRKPPEMEFVLPYDLPMRMMRQAPGSIRRFLTQLLK